MHVVSRSAFYNKVSQIFNILFLKNNCRFLNQMGEKRRLGIQHRVSIRRRSSADNLRVWQEIIWHCCQNDRLFQNKWPKRQTHATYVLDTWSSILQFVHNLFWSKLKWNARSKLFYFIIYRSSMPRWSSRTLTKLNSQRNKKISGSFQPDQEKACNICPFQRFQYFPKT